MTEEEKYNRFLDAQEHPENYSEDALKEILHDGESLAMLKRALMEERANKADIDVDDEWADFCTNHLEVHNARRLMRIAAIFIGVIFVVGVAFAAMTRLGIIRNPFTRSEIVAVKDSVKAPAEEPQSKQAPARNDASDTVAPANKVEPITKVFDNTTLATILDDIGKYYGVKVFFADSEKKSTRLYFEWNQANSLDEVIDVLNSFNQITITRQDDTITVE